MDQQRGNVRRIADPAPAPRLTTESTAATFYLNTTPSTFDEAEIACQTEGGHLAAYSSFEEQVEVESFYLDNYYLMAPFHKQYWMGYKARVWGPDNFELLDTTVPKDPAQNMTKLYYHWGNMTVVLPNKTTVVRSTMSQQHAVPYVLHLALGSHSLCQSAPMQINTTSATVLLRCHMLPAACSVIALHTYTSNCTSNATAQS
jgi:hypothetical protein